MLPFDRLTQSILNHLLGQATWARQRLAVFSGAQARIETGRISLLLRIDEAGYFTAGDAALGATVTISLPEDTPRRFLSDRASIFQTAKLSGSADFAECLGFVFRHLEWDSEADLARLLGDIPAHRIDRMAKASLRQAGESLERLGRNVVEYLTEESGALVGADELESFNRSVSTMRDDVERLEKRLQRLG